MSYETDQLKIANNKIALANSNIEIGKALERLRNNPDFELVVNQLFLKDEMLRITSLIGSHNLANPMLTQAEVRENLVRDLHAKATLEQFFDGIDRKANDAEREIRQAEADIADINGEGGADLFGNSPSQLDDGSDAGY